MYKLNDAPFSSDLFSNFASVVGIRRSETILLAIVRLKKDGNDYLAQYFRVKSDLFQATLSHFKKSSTAMHQNIQPVHQVLSNEKTSEFCVLYIPTLTVLERIESNRFLSDGELSGFLSHIQAGLIAQKSYLKTENLFLNEFNVFQCNEQFTIGISLPLPSHKILIPINEGIGSLEQGFYRVPHILPPELSGKMQIEIKTYDVFSLGILTMKAIGLNKLLEQKLDKSNNLPSDKKQYETALKEIFKTCYKDYNRLPLDRIERMLSYSDRPLIEKAVDGISVPKKINNYVGLTTFHSFNNGIPLEPGPQSTGHHGKKIFKKRCKRDFD